MKSSKKLFNFFFFKTKKEKIYVLKKLQKGNVKPLLVYLLYRLHLTKRILVRRKSYTIHLHYSPYALWLYFHPMSSRKEEEFVSFFLKEGYFFIDCGAHLGTVSLTASQKVGSSGRVLSIEAHPHTYALLCDNVAIAPQNNIQTMQVAVSDKMDSVSITSSYVSDMNHVSKSGRIIKSIRLDSLLGEHEKCHLLKLDVEGMEFQAMKGLGVTISNVDAILFESAKASFERYEYMLADILVFLKKSNFKVYRFPSDDITLLEEVSLTYETKTRYEDLVALSPQGRNLFQKKQGSLLPL